MCKKITIEDSASEVTDGWHNQIRPQVVEYGPGVGCKTNGLKAKIITMYYEV